MQPIRGGLQDRTAREITQSMSTVKYLLQCKRANLASRHMPVVLVTCQLVTRVGHSDLHYQCLFLLLSPSP